ncbi:FMN-binding protein [Cellulomonas triticagri]|uniref:FMN-binding protein n=1 Tax=Cellulomonas triticagri TaxID=2483352 RepID=A0A3M2JK30_9CELL|nr:FMN-binding protein [Cellulomonas triticagri]RMI12501.1 FMN-binding protein [Cellulomonas triticagri]
MTPTIRRRTLGVLSGLSVVVAVAACGNADAATDDTPDTGTSQQDTADDTASDDAADDGAAASGEYADGTYTAEGSYDTPGGEESISVEVTVADGVVTDVTVTPEASGGNAARFQDEFASGIADEVVGADLSDLAVDKVSGSSLTGNGFNAALEEIRADAAA